jgi:putative DNA methylase
MPTASEHRSSSILTAINWGQVSRFAAREVMNRETYSPAVSAYRWWARRPHSVMGTLLDVAVRRYGPRLLVSDPFSGGGTVAFEAARRGLRTYAQDLYPWPTYGLATTLAWVSETELSEALGNLQRELAPLQAHYTRPDGRQLSHILRVKAIGCPSCSRECFDLPAPMLSLCSRSPKEKQAFFCCAGCGVVSRRNRKVTFFKCDACDLRQSAINGAAQCPHCDAPKAISPQTETSVRWVPVLVSEVRSEKGRIRTVLRTIEHGDPVEPTDVKAPRELRAKIPPGQETNRLLAAGFTRWTDLYSGRQLAILTQALTIIRNLSARQQVRDRLALCVLGAAEMPAYISRWDRFHLKPFEGLANHRYSSSSLVAECNPLSPVGRGTLGRRFEASMKALRWLQEGMPGRDVSSRDVSSPGRRPRYWDVLVATGSSAHQALDDQAVNLVLTDPPYHDDVQYGELARLFHAWLRVYHVLGPVREEQEAVAKSTLRRAGRLFEQTIATCLAESNRTLRRDGVLLLTFHNKRLVAWRGLAYALHHGGFAVKAIAVVRAENRNDHCKRNVEAMLHDLVIECVKRDATPIKPKLAFSPKSAAEKNLAAIGLAVSEAAHTGDIVSLRAAYHNHLGHLKGRIRLIE